MPPIRLPGAARRLLAVLLSSLLVLLLLWLALPRLLGLAAEHWLAVPGLEELQVDVEEVGGEHARLREVRAVYQSAGGDRYRIALHDIAIDYSLPGGRAERLDIASGELELLSGQTAPPSPWPLLEWPDLPLGEAQVRDLRVTVVRPERPRLEARGDFRLRQTAGQWQAEFRPDADLLRITATPPQAPDTALEIHAEWLPAAGPAADARLTIGRQPAQQAARLLAQLPLPVLAALGRHLGLALPPGEISGSVRLQAEALLGETAGSVRALSGEAEFADTRLQATAEPLALELSGKLRFAWQASAAQLELLPGLRWQLAIDGEQALHVSGRQKTAFAIRHDSGVAVSEGELAFAVQSPQWGHWHAALRRLTLHGGTDPADWNSADAQLRLQGQLPPWQQKTMRGGELKAAGDATLHWSRSAEARSELSMQLSVGRLSWLSDPPLRVNASTWQVKAVALAKADDPFGPSLVVQGEASSPQLTAVLAGRPDKTLTLGASRLQLLRFRPAGRSAAGDAGDAPNARHAGGAEGEFLLSTDAIHIGNWPSPDLRARLRLDGDGLRADGTLRLQQTEVLSFAGSHALARGCGKATLTTQQNLPKLGQLLQPRPPALLKLALLAGEADARFAVEWCTKSKPRFDVKGKLQARAVALGWERARVEGLRTTLQLDGLQPLRGRLQLAARDGKLATGTSLSDLDVDLALAAQTLSVRALQVKLLGGAVASEPLDLPWPPSENPLPLQVRQIDLGQLLALLQVQDLSGSGQLGGVLPLAWRDGGVEVDNGDLSSAGGGTIKYAPPLLAPDNPGLQALRNFHFQQLGVRLWYGSEGAYRTRATLEGSNPDFYSGYPVRFRLNINGQLPGLFRAALFSGDFNRHILEQLQSGKLE